MPRRARIKSNTDTYHIMLRGINHQVIFQDDEDYDRFIEILKQYKTECDYKLYAWCLMDNHVHLVIKCESLETVMKKIGVSYAYYYNNKYDRSGHLFQDRFRSEVVENDSYLLTVVRYVHMNPVSAHMKKKPEDYRWSSYREYLLRIGDRKSLAGLYMITDTSLVTEMVGTRQFVGYTLERNEDRCLDMDIVDAKKRMKDSEALKLMEGISGCKSPEEFRSLGADERDEAIRELSEAGVGTWQMTRITGWSRQVIYNALR